jgi:AraC family transcriptional regulator
MGKVTAQWDDSSHMHAEVTQTFQAALSESSIGLSRVRSDLGNTGKTAPYDVHSAYLTVLQLRPFADQTLWVDGKLAPHAPFETGSIAVYDLERLWVSDLRDRFDSLHFYLPQAGLDAIADELGAKPNLRLCLPPHQNVRDDTVHRIGQLLLPALARPQEAPRLFVDHLALALHAHLIHRYGDRSPPAPRPGGQLAAWQARRAKDFLLAHLASDVTIEATARQCNLSRSHFTKAFRQTTGLTPHQWLTARRIEHARELMRSTDLPLAQIATACGFADQSHFSRVFLKACGITPGAWRRSEDRFGLFVD